MTDVHVKWTDVRFAKSSYSTQDGQCVEVAIVGRTVGVQDSKLGTSSPVLELNAAAFADFLAELKAS